MQKQGHKSKGLLIALGGFSGAGKSALGRALVRDYGVATVEIDYIWKHILGVAPHEKPPADSYTPERRAQVLAEYDECCRQGLAAGKTVVAQKTFVKAEDRAAIEALAQAAGADFYGFWLEAPVDLLKKRVRERVNDVSDTTEAVVDKQASMETGVIAWKVIQTDRDPALILQEVVESVAGLKDKNVSASP